MNLFLKIILSIVVIFVIIAASGFYYISRGLEKGRKLQINDVNLSNLEDGTYNGKYTAGRWTNEVKVTVKDHKIVSIEVLKEVAFPQPDLSKDLINKIIERQKINVDAVSGATVTTKAYEKSIENALLK
jgi:uncharacterized protein with FMN-binding domain